MVFAVFGVVILDCVTLSSCVVFGRGVSMVYAGLSVFGVLSGGWWAPYYSPIMIGLITFNQSWGSYSFSYFSCSFVVCWCVMVLSVLFLYWLSHLLRGGFPGPGVVWGFTCSDTLWRWCVAAVVLYQSYGGWAVGLLGWVLCILVLVGGLHQTSLWTSVIGWWYERLC